jgi:hypothetical protein
MNQPCRAAAMVMALAIAAVAISPPARAQGAEHCGADNGSLIVDYIADRVAEKLGPSLQGCRAACLAP